MKELLTDASRPSAPIVAKLKRYSKLAGIFTIVTGIGVLSGWWFRVPMLQSIGPGWATMKPNTALGFILSGISLVALQYAAPSRNIAQGTAALVTLIGLLTVVEYASGWELRIDALLVEPTPAAREPMSLATAVTFALFGGALFFLSDAHAALYRIGQLCAGLSMLIMLLALLGYLYGAPALYQIGPYSSVAMHTALTFLVLTSAALCARPESAYIAQLTSRAPGGIMARRLLVKVLIALPLLGWLMLEGQGAGLYEPVFGMAMLVTLIMLMLTGLIWLTAQALNLMAERAGLILDNALDAFIAINEKGEIVEWNRQAENIFGWPQSAVAGKLLSDTIIPERYREAHRNGLQRFLSTGHHQLLNRLVEIEALRRDGNEFPVELSIIPIWRAGECLFSASLRDITERQRAKDELQRFASELETRVAQRTVQLDATNKELEGFSYSVSHDLRVPLRAIDGFSRILEEDYANRLDEEGKRVIKVVRESCQKMSRLIDDLLSFSRLGRTPLSMDEVDMTSTVSEAIRELTAAGVMVPPIVIDALPATYCDRQLILQVWLNLLSNAVKFSSRQASPAIRAGGEAGTSENIYHVADNGAGFDMQYYDKLFGVFQRLHSADEFPGTGVGLAIVQRIVVRHGGRVWAEGKVDAGATFYFSLPTGVRHA